MLAGLVSCELSAGVEEIGAVEVIHLDGILCPLAYKCGCQLCMPHGRFKTFLTVCVPQVMLVEMLPAEVIPHENMDPSPGIHKLALLVHHPAVLGNIPDQRAVEGR